MTGMPAWKASHVVGTAARTSPCAAACAAWPTECQARHLPGPQERTGRWTSLDAASCASQVLCSGTAASALPVLTSRCARQASPWDSMHFSRDRSCASECDKLGKGLHDGLASAQSHERHTRGLYGNKGRFRGARGVHGRCQWRAAAAAAARGPLPRATREDLC